MAGKVKFYRGAQGTSLPNTIQDGAIFIVERAGTNNLGDMYVDIDNATRLHITPDKELVTYNPSMSGTQSTLGQTYIFQEENPRKIGIAVGDGSAKIGDLPVYDYTIINKITEAIVDKVNAYLGTEYNGLTGEQKRADGLTLPSQADLGETLVLSRELWLDF